MLQLALLAALLGLTAGAWPRTIPTIDWKTEWTWDQTIAASGVQYAPNVSMPIRYVVGNNAPLPPEVDIEGILIFWIYICLARQVLLMGCLRVIPSLV